MVAAEETYSEVLQVELVPRRGDDVDDDKQPLVLQVAAPNPILDEAIMKAKGQHIKGDAPPHFLEHIPIVPMHPVLCV